MRDWSIIGAEIVMTIGYLLVLKFGWPERHTVPKLGLIIKILGGVILTLWLVTIWMWVNV